MVEPLCTPSHRARAWATLRRRFSIAESNAQTRRRERESMSTPYTPDRMQEIVSLCKRRGFVFQSSEIYGGLKSAYDYGPLGVELKRNLMSEWWKTMVHSREDVVGLDSSIIMHPDVWRASGHLAGFSDPLVDCLVCKERFRADKAPRASEGSTVVLSFTDKGRAKTAQEWIKEQLGIALERDGKDLKGATAADRGYVCPNCNSPYLSKERQFNLMFRTSLGPVDAVGDLAEAIASGAFAGLSPKEVQAKMEDFMRPSTVYLRPETAQGMFVQFANVQQIHVHEAALRHRPDGQERSATRVTVPRTSSSVQLRVRADGDGVLLRARRRTIEWIDYWTKARIEWWRKLRQPSPATSVSAPHEQGKSWPTTPRAASTSSTTSPGASASSKASPTARITTSRSTPSDIRREARLTSIPDQSSSDSCPTSSSPPPAPRAASARVSERCLPRGR
jgi:DNA-directed RNA polymerase subunit RPC12/RpoP